VKLWASLYVLTWLLFFEIWLGFTPIARPITTYLHIGLGLLIVWLAYSNAARLTRTTVPGRIKRIARATFGLSLLMAVLGPLIYFDVGGSWTVLYGLTVADGIRFLHFVNAIAMIAQAAAAGLAYDMWEDHEFAKETAPGEVPPPPRPAGEPSPTPGTGPTGGA
jgi:hypothetical protein